jgi:hypothetical protein
VTDRAEGRPEGVASYHWPCRVWQHSLEGLGARSVEIRLGATEGPGLESDHTDTTRVFPAHEQG